MSTFPFSNQERDRRYAKIRALMKENGIDVLVAVSIGGSPSYEGNLRYFTGQFVKTNTGCQYIVFPLIGEPIYVLGYYSVFKSSVFAERYSWVKDVVALPQITDSVLEAIKKKGLGESTIGLAGPIPYFVYNALKEGLPKARLVNCDSLILNARIVKSPEEIKQIEQAAMLNDKAYEAVKKIIKPGVWEHEVIGVAEGVMRGGGAERTFNLVRSHPLGSGLQTWPLVPKQLQRGDSLDFEMTACYGGYWAQLNRIVSIGPPSKERAELYEICKEAHRNGAAKLRAGNSVGDVALAIDETIRNAGFVPESCGHGATGLDLVEAELKPGDKTPLEAGRVIILHPYCVTKQGLAERNPDLLSLIGPGDTYVITKSAPIRLTKSSWDMFIVSE